MDCEHLKTKLRKRTFADGTLHCAEQCLTCGNRIGNWLPTPDAPVENWDDLLQEQWNRQESVEWEVRRQQADNEFEKRRLQYHEYLQSPEWRDLRKRVLERDGYLCQGCLMADASIVHHLTYDHAMNEFLWELVSVCDPCHDRYHGVNMPSCQGILSSQ